MQVSKWGNSLAIRLPAAVVEALKLKEGDQIDIQVLRHEDLSKDHARERKAAVERLRSLRWKLPPDFKFNREEANER